MPQDDLPSEQGAELELVLESWNVGLQCSKASDVGSQSYSEAFRRFTVVVYRRLQVLLLVLKGKECSKSEGERMVLVKR